MTNGGIPHADCYKSPSERAVGAGRGRMSVAGRWDELLKQTARIPHADCFRSLSERTVGAGPGQLAVTGCWCELLKQTARIPHADHQKSVRAGRAGGPWTAGRDGLLV